MIILIASSKLGKLLLGVKTGNSITEAIDASFIETNYNTTRIACLCNEYPLKPHLYIVKLGYARI